MAAAEGAGGQKGGQSSRNEGDDGKVLGEGTVGILILLEWIGKPFRGSGFVWRGGVQLVSSALYAGLWFGRRMPGCWGFGCTSELILLSCPVGVQLSSKCKPFFIAVRFGILEN